MLFFRFLKVIKQKTPWDDEPLFLYLAHQSVHVPIGPAPLGKGKPLPDAPRIQHTPSSFIFLALFLSPSPSLVVAQIRKGKRLPDAPGIPHTPIFVFLPQFFQSNIYFSFSLPSRSSDPGPLSSLFSPLPTTVRASTLVVYLDNMSDCKF